MIRCQFFRSGRMMVLVTLLASTMQTMQSASGQSEAVEQVLKQTDRVLADAPTSDNAARSGETLPDATVATNSTPADTTSNDTIRFSFDRAPWRDVIRWIADEGDLALHVDELPTGSFTYSDPNSFTHEEALDRINLFLLPQGFTLVRSGSLLSVINLGDPRSMQQLDAMADLVSVEDLARRNPNEVVKCMFPLGKINPEEAVQELSVLNLMSTPEPLTRTNQLMVTDTVAKLRNVKVVLDAFQPSLMANGTVVKSFTLEHVDAEDILLVARPHLGLATGEMIGIDVSLSADLQGKHIFVTGVEDKVKLLEGLVTAIDQPDTSMSVTDGEMVLQSHPVEGGNLEVVYNVLQTLLAGKSIRLSMDSAAGSVVALATPADQREIEQTVAQLQADGVEFEVIELKTVDPYFAISLLDEMLNISELEAQAAAARESSSRYSSRYSSSRYGSSRDRDRGRETSSPSSLDIPKIDADPANGRLFVRAKRAQIEQIKEIIAGIDGAGSSDQKDNMRVLPLKGQQAHRALDSAVKFWRGPNPIILYRSDQESEPALIEKVVSDDPAESATANRRATSQAVSAANTRSQRVLTNARGSAAPAIRCQITPRGMLIQSDDGDALDEFENHLMTIAGPMGDDVSPPIVFYLKYTKADDSLRMLAELLDGGDSASSAELGTLVNGYVASVDSFLGSFVTSSDGTTTMTYGTITVVADTRLNRLIAQGTAGDIELIESYLKIIDKDDSLTSIETYGRSRVIELVNTKASDVAAVIRDAFAGRVSASNAASPNAGPQDVAQKEPKRDSDQDRESRGESSGSKKATTKKAAQNAKTLEPTMTVAVHEPSNSLIVTAPDQLFEQVEQLAMAVDSRGEQTIEVVTPVNGAVFETLLQQVMLGQEISGIATRPDRDSSRSGGRPPSPQRTSSGGRFDRK